MNKRLGKGADPSVSEDATKGGSFEGIATASSMLSKVSSCLNDSVTIFHSPRLRRVNNRKRTRIVCIASFVILVSVAVLGALVSPLAAASDLSIAREAPRLLHPFGTDNLGRDMLLRTLAGLSTSIGIGLLAALVSSFIALVLGTLAALGGKKIDACITWLIDLMLGIPHIVLLLLISYALGKGFWGVAIGVALTHWPSLCRVIRAEVLQVKQSSYVEVSKALGRGPVYIALHHVLPAVLPQYLVGLILLFPHAILHEAALTFLGFGLPPEMPAIGIILSESMNYLSIGMWWLALFPGLALLAVVLLFDQAGQSLRRLLDPARAQE